MIPAPPGALHYGLDVRPPLGETLAVALQHVFAVLVGMITPPLLIAGALRLDAADTAYLVSMSLFVSGCATILQSRRIGGIGSGLLSIQGTSFTFIAPVTAVAGAAMAGGASAREALGIVFGVCLAGAFLVLVLSRVIQHAGRVVTPVVTGTVVTLIGLTLVEVGMVSIGGGFDARADGSFGSLANLGLAGLVLAVILAAGAAKSARVRLLAVILGLGVGYLVALLAGKVHLAANSASTGINWPQPLRFGLGFDFGALVPFLFMYLITAIESIGDLTATSQLSGQPITGPSYFARLRGGLLADGISSAVGACLNSFPSTTFAQNNGVIQLTGVGSRHVGLFVGGLLILLGLLPGVGLVAQSLPPPVLGGATLLMFGMVAASGIRILAQLPMDRRNVTILATSLGLGLGVTFVPDVIAQLPSLLRSTFSSGIATGGIAALVLNLLLPGREGSAHA